MPLVDTHCHLYSLPDPPEAIRRALDAGVNGMLVVSEDLATMREVLKLKENYPDNVFAGLGLHPANAMNLSMQELDEVYRFILDHGNEVSVIGEIGLDYKHAETENEQSRQMDILRAQMEIAVELGVPINLHSRRALRQTMQEAIAFHTGTGLNACLHWFAHSKKLIRNTNEHGIYVSTGPSILFSEQSLDVALTIDPRLLLIETDTPVPYNGISAEPCWSAEVLQKLRSGSADSSLEQTVYNNSLVYLGLSPEVS